MEIKNVISTDKLEKYIVALRIKLSEIGYSQRTIQKYDNIWNALLQYAKSSCIQEFNPDYYQRFALERYGGCPENKYDAYRINRPLTLLLDFISFGTVFKSKNYTGQGFTSGFSELFSGFLKGQVQRGLAENSIKSIRSRLYRLEWYLLSVGIERFCDVTLEIVNKYIESLAGRGSSMASETVRELGRLSDYALKNGFHSRTFSNSIPRVKNIRRQRIPHIFTPEETQKLLGVVDRNNPVGKRDYAMLMIAAKLGLRVGDIRLLTFSAIDWTNKTISIVQQKTGKFLELTLLDDVGWAIIDYVKHGRPICDSRTVFVSHTQPFNNLNPCTVNLVAKYMRKAGIKTPQNKRIGMHTLRHSLASEMLQQKIMLPTISEVLGHADIHSTESYIRVDISSLRQCPLEVEL